jgi:putative component of toxin-antitoxin plasmid stabilization module
LLLCGGDKSTQQKDINLAKLYWKDYANRQNSPN